MAAAKGKTGINVAFTAEKDTKNTRKFLEVVADGASPVIGVLYVQKSALTDLGADPQALTVTVTEAVVAN